MDNNNTPNVAHNDDNGSGAAGPIIDIAQAGPTAVMDSNRQPPMTPEAQQELVDMLMTIEENDDMPSLDEASFTESDVEDIVVDSNLVAQDLRIPAFQQNNDILSASSSQSSTFSTSLPPPSSTPNSPPHPQRSGNRRARVEDDDDAERDLRHPSERVGGSNGHPSTSNAPFFGPFFPSFRDAGAALGLGLGSGVFNRTPIPNPSENSSTPNMNAYDSNTNPTPNATTSSQSQTQGPPLNASGATNRRAPMQFIDYEFSIVMDGSRRPQPAQAPLNDLAQGQPDGNVPTGIQPGPTVAGAAGPPPNISFNPPIPLGNLATLLGIPFPLPGGSFGFPEEKEDPERAKKLVDGLGEVPVGLVRRLERVGTGGGGIGEDESKGGDVGCAVCWDRLLREEVEQEQVEEPTGNRGDSESMNVDGEAGETTKEEGVEPKYPKVVSLPCAHVFHAECLIPWFSQPRHTTCPTCRFNIDPDNLTYVSPRQRREQQSAANNVNNVNQPEGTPEDRHADLASTTSAAATMDAGEQPSQPREQQGEVPVVGLGGFAGILQMLNAQGQLQPAAGAPDNGAVPSGAQPQAQGPQAQGLPPLMMSIPMLGGAGIFPPAFAAGQLPMPMPMPFMAVPLPPGNVEGDSFLRSGMLRTTNVTTPPHSWVNPLFWSAVPMPMPMPWRMMADSLGGGNRANATNADASAGAPGVDDANAPSTTAAGPSPSNNAPQTQTPHHPPIVADVVRISVDMVFDGRPRRQANQAPANNVAQPATGNTTPHTSSQEQATDDDGDHDPDDEPPALMSLEEAEEEDRHFTTARNAASPAENNNPEQTPHGQPSNRPVPPVYSMGDIHVAGTGRSFGEAFTQALSRLQTRMAQPGQNPQPADAAAADEDAPPPPPPPPQQTQAETQGQDQRPWQFMAMPFMDFTFPMRAPQPDGPKRAWVPPPPPGPTLRQRIERREWEAGLRCHDVSCGLGPSDEDPLGDDINESLRKGQQLSILSREEEVDGSRKPFCGHRFHKTCLVSAERVALRGAEATADEAGCVEVSCPVCRGTGCVTKEQWDEGALALQ